MTIIDHPQGSIEWITNRLWRLTASEAKAVITSTGKLSKSETATKAIDKLIAGIDLANVLQSESAKIDEMDEWELKKFMSHYTGEKFSGSTHTERGHECEADAIAAISAKIGKPIQDVGMCVMGDNANGVVSCSPDGLILDASGRIVAGCEVKSPSLCNYYGHVADGVFPSDYKLQVHMSMAICEVDSWHFGSYFRGKPVFHVEVLRDSYTDTIAASLREFVSVYESRLRLVRNRVENLTGGIA